VLFDRDDVDLSLRRVMELHHRAVSREQMRRFEGYLAEIFAACGLNLNTPATEETPRRFLQALFEATEGYDGEPKLLKVFNTECRGNPDGRLGQVIETHPLFRAVRAPCPAIFRACLHRLSPASVHHRHFQAHPPPTAVCQTFYGPGTAGGADCEYLRCDA